MASSSQCQRMRIEVSSQQALVTVLQAGRSPGVPSRCSGPNSGMSRQKGGVDVSRDRGEFAEFLQTIDRNLVSHVRTSFPCVCVNMLKRMMVHVERLKGRERPTAVAEQRQNPPQRRRERREQQERLGMNDLFGSSRFSRSSSAWPFSAASAPTGGAASAAEWLPPVRAPAALGSRTCLTGLDGSLDLRARRASIVGIALLTELAGWLTLPFDPAATGGDDDLQEDR